MLAASDCAAGTTLFADCPILVARASWARAEEVANQGGLRGVAKVATCERCMRPCVPNSELATAYRRCPVCGAVWCTRCSAPDDPLPAERTTEHLLHCGLEAAIAPRLDAWGPGRTRVALYARGCCRALGRAINRDNGSGGEGDEVGSQGDDVLTMFYAPDRPNVSREVRRQFLKAAMPTVAAVRNFLRQRLATLDVDCARDDVAEVLEAYTSAEGFDTFHRLCGANGAAVAVQHPAVAALAASLAEEGPGWVAGGPAAGAIDTVNLTGGAHEDLRGTALYPWHSRLNHSCCPNAEVVRIAGDARIELRAKHVIPKGTEITISYLSAEEVASMAASNRRAELHARYGFVCGCALCV